MSAVSLVDALEQAQVHARELREMLNQLRQDWPASYAATSIREWMAAEASNIEQSLTDLVERYGAEEPGR